MSSIAVSAAVFCAAFLAWAGARALVRVAVYRRIVRFKLRRRLVVRTRRIADDSVTAEPR